MHNCKTLNDMKKNNQPNITLAPLQPDDRELFILDNQWAFKYGATPPTAEAMKVAHPAPLNPMPQTTISR